MRLRKTRIHPLWFALWVMLSLAACQTAAPVGTREPTQEIQNIFDAPWGERDVFRANWVLSEQGILDELPGATEYHIEFTIADDFNLLSGHEAVHFTNQVDIPLGAVYFRLYPNIMGGRLTISNVIVDGEEVETRLEAVEYLLESPASRSSKAKFKCGA
ncbi:MAG: hypothetical protein V3T55_06420 [Anaerolineales bacterium]